MQWAGLRRRRRLPEVYAHPGALPQIATLIWQAVASGAQIVLATHSLELVDALLSASSAELARSAVYRLRPRAGELTAARLAGTEALERKTELEEDLRR